MKKHLVVVAALGAASLISPAEAGSESTASYTVELQVPVICNIRYRASPTAQQGDGYELGDLREFCNAPTGYALTVDYAPGSMRGAVLSVGSDRVVLDGSGTTTVSRMPGPAIRDRTIVATPGPAGFDTDMLNFHIVPV